MQEASKTNIAEQFDLDVALVHDWLTVQGASEDVFGEVCNLFPGDIFAARSDPGRDESCEGLATHTSWVQNVPSIFGQQLVAPVLPGVYGSMETEEFDLILSDSHGFSHHVPKRAGGLHISYFHSPADTLWAPDREGCASDIYLDAVKGLFERQLRKVDAEASKNPDIILANSYTTARRIEQRYGRHADAVIYPPVDTEKWSGVQRKGEGLGFLMVGDLLGYKRADLAIQAAKRLNVPLQIVGSGPKQRKMEELAGGHRKITFHGETTDADLKEIMSRCEALLFPGCEDFGSALIEALAAGLPVIAYGQGGAAETVTNKCGILFEEQSVDSLVEAMRQVNHRSFEPDHLREHAGQFDRLVFRRKYCNAVTEAVANHFEQPNSKVRAYAA